MKNVGISHPYKGQDRPCPIFSRRFSFQPSSSSLFTAVLASLPLTSILAMTWLYIETRDTEKVASLSVGIFGAVLPSLLFFIALPLLLRSGARFSWAMLSAAMLMFIAYSGYVILGRKLGMPL